MEFPIIKTMCSCSTAANRPDTAIQTELCCHGTCIPCICNAGTKRPWPRSLRCSVGLRVANGPPAFAKFGRGPNAGKKLCKNQPSPHKKMSLKSTKTEHKRGGPGHVHSACARKKPTIESEELVGPIGPSLGTTDTRFYRRSCY